MKTIRRIDGTQSRDPYRRAQRALLRSFELDEATFQSLRKRRPSLVVIDGDAVLAGEPRRGSLMRVHYAFPHRDAFTGKFPSMFGKLAAATNEEDAPLGFALRLTDRSLRGYLEPVLRAQAFELNREWMRMTIPLLPVAGPSLPEGYAVRPLRTADMETVIELEAAAFPQSTLTPETLRPAGEGHWPLVLERGDTGEVVGYLRLRRETSREGYVSDVAVHPEYQNHGLGEALMRWALAFLREQGFQRASLTVDTDNARAIALYQKLGFFLGEMGIDYRRPIDEDEVRQVLEKHRSSHITMRRRV
jgi:ribosomal protein S18 acetylase RimI-like enzyme